MLRFEYPYSYDYRIPVTPQLGSGVGVYFPSFPPNATVANGDGSDSEQSSFDDFNNNSNNNEPINEETSLLSDSLPAENPSSEYYANTPLFSPKTINAANEYNTTTPNHRNSISISAPSDDLSEFVMGEGGNESKPELVSDLTEFPAVDLLPPPMTTLPPLPVGTADAPSESDDEELFRAKKQKPSNDTLAPKKSTARRGRKSAAAKAAEAAQAAVTATASVTSSSSSVSSVTVVGAPSENHRKTSTGSDEENDHSDSPHSSHHSSSDHYRTKHSISETRRRTRLRNQFKYLAEASASAKTDRYSVLCAAIVKIEAAKRRIAELESQLAAATVGRSGLSPMPAVSSAPSAMCCAESIEYGVCSQCSGVATALLSGDGVGTFLSANHRWLALIGVSSLPELQSVAPSFLKVVGTSTAEVSSARSTLSAVSAHKHGSMTLPLDSNTILAYKNHSDSSIEPALLYANIRHFPTKSSRPALFTLSSYEHGAADNRNPCVLVTAVPCEPLPEGVTVSSYNDRLAHRGRKAGGGHISPPLSDSSSSSTLNNNGAGKKDGKKRSYSQRVARSNGGEGEGMNARIGNQLMMDEGL